MNDDPYDDNPDGLDDYELSVMAALTSANIYAERGVMLYEHAETLESAGTDLAIKMADAAIEGSNQARVMAAALIAAAGFGDNDELHAFLNLNWLGRDRP